MKWVVKIVCYGKPVGYLFQHIWKHGMRREQKPRGGGASDRSDGDRACSFSFMYNDIMVAYHPLSRENAPLLWTYCVT